MTTHCESCGKPWTEHLGIAGTCAENKRLRNVLRECVGIVAVSASANDNPLGKRNTLDLLFSICDLIGHDPQGIRDRFANDYEVATIHAIQCGQLVRAEKGIPQ